nr:hypothetical protein Iba_chr04aCG5460 [Ipomoea batatas]
MGKCLGTKHVPILGRIYNIFSLVFSFAFIRYLCIIYQERHDGSIFCTPVTPVFNAAPAPLESFIFFNLIPLEALLCLRRVCSLPQLHRPPIVDSSFTAPPSSTRPVTLAAAQLRIFSAIEFDTEENCWLNKGHYLA